MKFKKVFRGYSPDQVDQYIKETSEKEAKMRALQKERIDQLSDENFILRRQLKQYQNDEQAIAKSLIESQHLADEVKGNADKYSELVLNRAKTFYAAWKAYSQTLVASLTDEEVLAFNKILQKIENLINAYQGGSIADDPTVVDAEKFAARGTNFEESVGDDEVIELDFTKNREELEKERESTSKQVDSLLENIDSLEEIESATASEKEKPEEEMTAAEKSVNAMQNPIKKVEEAAEQAIDLREILKPEQSLEELCADLGLISPPKKTNKK